MTNPDVKLTPDQMLADDMGQFFADPMGFVMYAYDWDNDESIQMVELSEPWASRYNSKYGPDVWACEILDEIGEKVKKNNFNGHDPVPAIQEAIASGHGIGKSVFISWICNWIMSTRPFARGTITANTSPQLETKTWPEISKWTKKCITGHWFDVTNGKGNMRMRHKHHPEQWFCSAQTCREENSDSYQGQHAANSTSFYLFDEASRIPNVIWDVSEGGKTDGEPMHFAFGNPTTNSGGFFECFNKFRRVWTVRNIDSRTVKITNKDKIKQDIEMYGADSDYCKVRIYGQFPSQGDKQFIPTDLVEAAERRELEDDQYAPLVLGIDFARSGSAKTVLRARRGRKAFKAVKFKERDSMKAVAIISNYLDEAESKYGSRFDAVFGDGGGIGGPIIDRLNQLHYKIIEVQFGEQADDPKKFANKRAEIWHRNREWLKTADIDRDPELHDDLIAPEYYTDAKDRLVLESKKDMEKRGLASPDDGDSLALTHSFPVERRDTRFVDAAGRSQLQSDFDPYGD